MSAAKKKLKPVLLSGVVFALIWLVLTGGDATSWLVGVPVVVVAWLVYRSALADTESAIRPGRLLRFIPFFLAESVRGGFDVAARAFGRKPRLSCGIIPFESGLTGAARIFFIHVVGLLPGTLVTVLQDDAMLIHTLDNSKTVEQELRVFEQRVAQLFVDPPSES